MPEHAQEITAHYFADTLFGIAAAAHSRDLRRISTENSTCVRPRICIASCRRIQVDECWAFIGAKQRNLTPENIARGAVGDIWLWTQPLTRIRSWSNMDARRSQRANCTDVHARSSEPP